MTKLCPKARQRRDQARCGVQPTARAGWETITRTAWRATVARGRQRRGGGRDGRGGEDAFHASMPSTREALGDQPTWIRPAIWSLLRSIIIMCELP